MNETEMYAALYAAGWHECKLTVFFTDALSYPTHRVRLEVFRLSYQQDFYGATIEQAFANALTWTTEHADPCTASLPGGG